MYVCKYAYFSTASGYDIFRLTLNISLVKKKKKAFSLVRYFLWIYILRTLRRQEILETHEDTITYPVSFTWMYLIHM